MKPSVVSIPLLFFLVLWATEFMYAQDTELDLKDEIRAMLPQGEHAFHLLKTKTAARNQQRKINTGDYGKKPSPPVGLPEEPQGPLVDFQSVNILYLDVRHTPTELQITPLRNSFFPEVRIAIYADQLFLEEYTLHFEKAIVVLNRNNALGSSWKGYRWKSEGVGPDKKVQCRFTLGKLEADGKVYIDVRWLVNGKPFHYRLLG